MPTSVIRPKDARRIRSRLRRPAGVLPGLRRPIPGTTGRADSSPGYVPETCASAGGSALMQLSVAVPERRRGTAQPCGETKNPATCWPMIPPPTRRRYEISRWRWPDRRGMGRRYCRWLREVAMSGRGTAVLTGVGRRRSIGARVALGLAEDGWDLVLNHWAPYDERLAYERGQHDTQDVAAECRRRGSQVEVVPADLAAIGSIPPSRAGVGTLPSTRAPGGCCSRGSRGARR